MDASIMHIGPVVTESTARDGSGQLTYAWRNPVTGRIESKHTCFRRLDGKLVGVGYFTR